MNKFRARLPQLVIVLFVAIAVLWYFNLDWEERSIDLGPTPEARRNPALALQRLLEQREKSVELVQGFAGIEQLKFGTNTVGNRDALILLNTGASLRDAQVEALWNWVSAGGQLIVTVNNPYFDTLDQQDDPLLERLGLTLVEIDRNKEKKDVPADGVSEQQTGDAAPPTPPEETDSAKPDESPENTEAENAAAKAGDPTDHCDWLGADLPVKIPGRQWKELRMKFRPYLAFAEAEDAGSDIQPLAIRNEHIFLAHMEIGDGEIFAFPNIGPLDNVSIVCRDNAFVLWDLLHDRDKVWLLLNVNSPSFWTYLWHLSALGCLAMLASLALWLWYKVPRFGPILERPVTGRRQFLDHIQASAHFLVRHQGTQALVKPLREELRQKLRLRHPGFFHLSTDDQIAKLAQLSGMERNDIHLALYQPLPVQDAVFIDIVQRLQLLRNSI